MGEWYSLEGLAARFQPDVPLSVLQKGFKRAFGKVLAVTGREGEVNDHFGAYDKLCQGKPPSISSL